MSQELHDYLQEGDERYAQHWDKEADFWGANGFYARLAEKMCLAPSSLHVDSCSGRADLLAELRLRHPDAGLLGVEIKPPLITRSITALESRRLQGIGYVDLTYRIAHNAVIHTEYEWRPDNVKTPLLRKGGPIALVCDDIRKHKLVEQILAGEKIDSGSCGFSGGTQELIARAPFPARIKDRADAQARLVQIQQDLQHGTYQFMSKTVKPGGKFHLYERASFGEDATSIDIASTVGSWMGKYTKYWDNPVIHLFDRRVLNMVQPGEGLTWQSHTNEGVQRATVPCTVFMCTLTRNEEKMV